MSSNLQAWEAYINQRISQIIRQYIPAVLIDYGSITPSTAGWTTIYFSKPFPAPPGVFAIQGGGTASPKSQQLTPPQLTAPTISAPRIPVPSLASLKLPVISPPISWGDRVKQIVSQACGSTIGQVPVIGGFLCSGIDSTFGELLAIVANGIQSLYYAFDWQALASAIQQGVEAKVSADWNANIDKLQATLDSFANNVNSGLSQLTGVANTALASLTSVTQDAINAVWPLIAQAMGLAQNEALPVVKVRNVTTVSAQVYAPGNNVPIYWLAIYSGK